MFFRGISSSPWSRAAYLLVILCFVTVPIHFISQSHFLDRTLIYFSAGVFVFSLLVAIIHSPKDVRLGFYGCLACLLHFCL